MSAGDPVEQGRPVAGRRAGPVGLVEGATCRRDGRLDLGVGRDVHLGDDRGVGRVEDRAAGAVRGRDPLAVDEEAWHDDLGAVGLGASFDRLRSLVNPAVRPAVRLGLDSRTWAARRRTARSTWRRWR